MQKPEKPTSELEILGRNIKQLRENSGIKQDDLADAVGVKDGRTIRFWEKGINAPTFAHMVKLAKIFGISMQELLKDL